MSIFITALWFVISASRGSAVFLVRCQKARLRLILRRPGGPKPEDFEGIVFGYAADGREIRNDPTKISATDLRNVSQ